MKKISLAEASRAANERPSWRQANGKLPHSMECAVVGKRRATLASVKRSIKQLKKKRQAVLSLLRQVKQICVEVGFDFKEMVAAMGDQGSKSKSKKPPVCRGCGIEVDLEGSCNCGTL